MFCYITIAKRYSRKLSEKRKKKVKTNAMLFRQIKKYTSGANYTQNSI